MLQHLVELLLLAVHALCTGTTPTSTTPQTINIPPLQKTILKDMSWALKSVILKEYFNKTEEKTSSVLEPEKGRRVGVQALELPSRRLDMDTDDSNMKMKLFRLMYETVRDSDLKVKRAELIKKSYANSSSFEVGYLLGDITDKYNIMTDIALTLKRLYHEWKPIEHINAYEQIANLAIEITHIVDMIRSLEKKLDDEARKAKKKSTEDFGNGTTTPKRPHLLF